MKLRLTRRYVFSAAHRLHSSELSDEENRAAYGKCNNPHGHGHNYALEVTVEGAMQERTGMICDLARLDAVVHAAVLDRYDHMNLNTLPEFMSTTATSENLAIQVEGILRRAIDFAHLEQVRIEETPRNSFACCGKQAARGRGQERL